MIMSLIDYSKYKVQEANFKFWDNLSIIIFFIITLFLFYCIYQRILLYCFY